VRKPNEADAGTMPKGTGAPGERTRPTGWSWAFWCAAYNYFVKREKTFLEIIERTREEFALLLRYATYRYLRWTKKEDFPFGDGASNSWFVGFLPRTRDERDERCLLADT
jgi:hypothetical protein